MRKPTVKTNCVANTYTSKNERIIEYTFGGDGRGNALGGLIQFIVINGEMHVNLYNHNKNIKIVVCRADPMEVGDLST